VAKRKRRLWRYPDSFRAAALQRVRDGETVAAVAQDLDVEKALIYRWMYRAERGADQAPTRADGKPWQNRQAPQPASHLPTEEGDSAALREENRRLKEALAEKSLEVDFFKGALQKVEARRQSAGKTGETPSTPKSRR
jgi:transposase-like protein